MVSKHRCAISVCSHFCVYSHTYAGDEDGTTTSNYMLKIATTWHNKYKNDVFASRIALNLFCPPDDGYESAIHLNFIPSTL